MLALRSASRLVLVMLLLAIFAAAQTATSAISSSSSSSSPSPSGAVPNLINYASLLKDGTGKTLTSMTGVTFLIYKDEQGGAPLWIETQNVTPDHTGRYTVQLGSTTAQGLPASIFQNGEARWLAVQLAGEAEQPRALLVAVPYAMKAQDAETIGGLPPSAFVLAAVANNAVANTANATGSALGSAPPPSSDGGTVNAVPLFSTATSIQSSAISQAGSGATAKIGINTTAPASTLDVHGVATVRGNLSLPPLGAATTAAGKSSQPLTFTASTYNSGSGSAVNESFRWQAEAVANNTTNATGTLNLLFGLGTHAPAETGLKIASTGHITFASGQVFPGTVGSVALAAPSSDFTVSGSPVTTSGTLNLAWTVPPTAVNTPSAIVKRDSEGDVAVSSIYAASTSGGYAVSGYDNSIFSVYGGVYGQSNLGIGVSGNGNVGVNGYGTTGVVGGGTTGVSGNGVSYGVSGSAQHGPGVYGTGASGLVGVAGAGTSGGTGVSGTSDTGIGVSAVSTSGTGVSASAGGTGPAVNAYGDGTVTGILAGSKGYAGWFNGDVEISGGLYVSGQKDFKIDHPVDPANKYLSHSSVESSEMKNIYDGNVTTDAEGTATVQLPDWFEALNTDFRYQLTVIGQFAQAIVAKKIENNQFQIKTSLPNVEVSWQVTGVRQDAYAKAHPLQVEQDKPERERGFYIHPELFGASEEKGILWATAPRAMQQWKAAQAKAASSDANEPPEVPAKPSVGQPLPLPVPPKATASSIKRP